MQKFQVGQPNVQCMSDLLGKWVDVDVLEYVGEKWLNNLVTGTTTHSKHTYIVTTEHLAPGSCTHMSQEDMRIRPNEDDKTNWEDMMNKIKDGVPA